MSIFQMNDRVRSETNAQGLVQGQIYTVEGIAEQRLFLGVFITYTIRADNGARHSVRNGHLLLSKV